MKQNLSGANLVTVIVLGALVSSGCVKRERQHSVHSNSSVLAASADTRRTNINTATAEELEQLPGIGRVIAERIVEHRQQHGPFRRIEHVMMVRGISERKFLDMEPLITVH